MTDLPPAGPSVIVVTGVAGSGKTTVGRLLAARLDREYADGDDFHTPENVARMRDGTPLTDADRRPWLDTIARWIDTRIDARAAGARPAVVSCSALKRAYRTILGTDRPEVLLVYLHADPETIERRVRERSHFFNPAILVAQFADLEPPEPAEGALWVASDALPDALVDRIVAALPR